MSFNEVEIARIQEEACNRIAEVFDALGIDYTERHDYLQAACPVHKGDNQRAMFWAIQSSHWQCKTNNCHRDPITGPSTSVFGLVRGTMANKTGKPWTFNNAVKFVAQALGISIYQDSATAQDIEIAKILKQNRKRRKRPDIDGIPLSEMVSKLKPDTTYYPERGVSPEIIAKYHISFCDTEGKYFYKRAFFPVLDGTGKYIMGWSGRSIYGQCGECKMYHHPRRHSCPDKKGSGVYAKWRHSEGFRGESLLYNYWYAKPFISKTGTAILCEGPGDVWAYEMAGIHNTVAMLGSSMSRQQRLLLQNAGALTLICTLDNDDAGKKASERIKQNLQHYFRIFCVTPDTVNDIGDMLPDDLADKMTPLLCRASRAEILSDGYGTENESNG